MDDFDFIADQQYKALLIRDFTELQSCLENKASKSVLILSGSIIETVLLEFFTHNLPEGVTETELLKKDLDGLIKEAEAIRLISAQSKDLSTVIKNYRNLIHPGREIRKNEKFDYETATVSFSLVKIILKEIKENYIQKYGYTAGDIFNKIKVDSSTYSIYEKLILKLNDHEKLKLINYLVEYEIDAYDINDRLNYYRYIKPLKRGIGNHNLLMFCKRLLKEVEKGEKHRIYVLFEIFGEDIGMLPNDEKDLILAYIYNKVESVSAWDQEIENPRIQKLFSFLGLYLHTPEIKKKFFNLLANIVRYHSYTKFTKWHYTSTYQDMIAELSESEKSKCEEIIRATVTKEIADYFYTELAESDLPF